MALQLYNTATRRKEEFKPLDPARVGMYVCGPTVYDLPHIGNARPVIVFDVLFRLLRRQYGAGHVTYVRNITDVDDKIIAAAKANNEPIEALTARTAEAFHADAAKLGCLAPSIEPRATAHIAPMIAMIETLMARGHAYAADGHVLFHVPSMADYGKLSGRNRDDLIAGARVEVAPYKKDPGDFVLWKPGAADQPGWDSPWGRGRPGWHIECSAMAKAHLGASFDIHGGGRDLIFPHHENEVAQSVCANSAPFARVWVHNGFVTVNGEKMAKSVGNVVVLQELLGRWPGEAVRLAMLKTHYRQPLDWTEERVQEAQGNLDRWYRAIKYVPDGSWGHKREYQRITEELLMKREASFMSYVENDLDTSSAFYELEQLATDVIMEARPVEHSKGIALLRKLGSLLGILQIENAEDWFHWMPKSVILERRFTDSLLIEDTAKVGVLSTDEIERMIRERGDARKAKNFPESDRIRDELLAQGVVLEDKPGGKTEWRRK